MRMSVEKSLLLNFLKLSDYMQMHVMEEESTLRLVGLKKKSQMVSYCDIELEDCEIFSDELFTFDDKVVSFLDQFLKTMPKDIPAIILEKEAGMPEVEIIHDNGRLSLPMSFDEKIDSMFEEIETSPIDTSTTVEVERGVLEMLKRANTFVEGNSELEAAQYLDLILQDKLITASGFSGLSGYSEDLIVEDDLAANHYRIHSYFVDDLYSSRTAFNKDINISRSINTRHIVVHNDLYRVYIENPTHDVVDFTTLFNQNYNVSGIQIPFNPWELALKSIPRIGSKTSVVGFKNEGKGLIIGTDIVSFKISDSETKLDPMFFRGKALDSFMKSVKKLKLKEPFNICECKISTQNKILYMETLSRSMEDSEEKSSARFMAIGLDLLKEVGQ